MRLGDGDAAARSESDGRIGARSLAEAASRRGSVTVALGFVRVRRVWRRGRARRAGVAETAQPLAPRRRRAARAPSRSDGDAGGTGSVVSKAMKSPSPLSEFRFSCAKRFSPLACFPAPAPVSSAPASGGRPGTRAALGAGGETRGRGLGRQDHARVTGSTGSKVRGVFCPRRVRARASEGTSGAEG